MNRRAALGLAYRHTAIRAAGADAPGPDQVDERKLVKLARDLGYTQKPEQALKLAEALIELRKANGAPEPPSGPLDAGQVEALMVLAKSVAKATIGSWTAETAAEGDWHTLLFRTPAITKGHEETAQERREVLATYQGALTSQLKLWAQGARRGVPKYAVRLEENDWVSFSIKVR